MISKNVRKKIIILKNVMGNIKWSTMANKYCSW